MKFIRLKEKCSDRAYNINPEIIKIFHAYGPSLELTRVFFKDGEFLDFKISEYDLIKMLEDKKFDEREFAQLRHD